MSNPYPAEFRERARRMLAEARAGQTPGTTSEVQLENKRLKKQIAELKKANETLCSASVFFATELDCPSSRRSASSM